MMKGKERLIQQPMFAKNAPLKIGDEDGEEDEFEQLFSAFEEDDWSFADGVGQADSSTDEDGIGYRVKTPKLYIDSDIESETDSEVEFAFIKKLSSAEVDALWEGVVDRNVHRMSPLVELGQISLEIININDDLEPKTSTNLWNCICEFCGW